MSIRVFVYGSLKRGFHNHPLLANHPGTKFLGEATTSERYRMVGYSSGTYPYLVRESINIPAEATYITGELYEITEACLSDLDALEGHPDFYTRCEININGQPTYVYLAEQPDVIQDIRSWIGSILCPVPSGIWKSKSAECLNSLFI